MEPRTLQGHRGSVMAVAFSPDGKTLASGSGGPEAKVWFWPMIQRPFIPGKFRSTPIRLDGTRYSWTLTYDPQANSGGGRFQFTIQSHGTEREPLEAKRLPADLAEAHRKEALRRFPNTMQFAVDLPRGFKKEGAAFDRFGLLNLMKPGNAMTIYFGDLRHDGVTEDFTKDPGWIGSRNRAKIEHVPVGAHDLGFSAKTNFAGGKPGELGGDLWRSGKYAYYANRIGPLTLDDRLEASGKVVFLDDLTYTAARPNP